MKTCAVEILLCVAGPGVTPERCEKATGLQGSYAWSRDDFPMWNSWGVRVQVQTIDLGEAMEPLLEMVDAVEASWMGMMAENSEWRASVVFTVTIEDDPTPEDYPRVAFSSEQVRHLSRLGLAVDVTFR